MSCAEKYKRTFVLSVQRSMEYRASFFISILSAAFPIIMQYFLWTAIFNNSKASVIYGFTYEQMIMYTALSSIVSIIVRAGFEWEIANDIKNGGLNAFIVKPIGYFSYRASSFLGGKSVQLVIMLALISFLLSIVNMVSGAGIEPIRVLIFAVIIFFAVILNFLMFFCLSTAAFWATEVWGIYAGFEVLINLLSGGLFPIDVFGERAVYVLNYLPFAYTIYFPVRVLNGNLDISSTLEGVLIQLIWIGLLTLASKLLWSAGTKKYVAVGG